MNERVVSSVDHEDLLRIFRTFNSPETNLAEACQRIDHLIKSIREIEVDIEVDETNNLVGKRPQDRRTDFKRLAKKLDEVAIAISILDRPNKRFLENPARGFRIKPIGLSEFREGIMNQFTEPLKNEYISKFGVTPLKWDPSNVSMGPVNTFNKALAINYTAERIALDLISRMAAGLRDADALLAKATPKGGARPNLIRDNVLLNLVALWHDLFEGTRGIYVSEQYPDLKNFCEALCQLLGVSTFCSTRHLRAATATFNREFRTKPRPKSR